MVPGGRAPFAPGESPFRIKGTGYQGFCAIFENRLPGGMIALRARLEDPRSRTFFEQPFLAGSSYDVFPLVEASEVAAHLVGVSPREFLRVAGREQAERDLHGVYRVFLKFASPSLVAERLPRILVQYFNFGAIGEGRHVGSTRYEAKLGRLPRAVASWLFPLAEGFVPVVVSAAGARNASMVFASTESDGVDARAPELELVGAHFGVSWIA